MAKSRSSLEREQLASGESLVDFDDDALTETQNNGTPRSRRGNRGRKDSPRRHRLLAALIVVFFLVVFVAALALAYEVDTFLATDPRFTLAALERDGDATVQSPLEISGLQHTRPEDVMGIFRDDVGRSLYLLPLHQRREELLAIDWVENVSVSRIWPNRLRVAIRERTPVAVVAFNGGNYGSSSEMMLVDRYGEMMPRPQQADYDLPVVYGLEPSQSADFRLGRIQLLERLQNEVEPLNARFSELFVDNPRNVRVTLVMDGRNLTLLLGDDKYLTRVQSFLNNYEAVMKEDPHANLFDMRLEDRIIASREGLSGA